MGGDNKSNSPYFHKSLQKPTSRDPVSGHMKRYGDSGERLSSTNQKNVVGFVRLLSCGIDKCEVVPFRVHCSEGSNYGGP